MYKIRKIQKPLISQLLKGFCIFQLLGDWSLPQLLQKAVRFRAEDVPLLNRQHAQSQEDVPCNQEHGV